MSTVRRGVRLGWLVAASLAASAAGLLLGPADIDPAGVVAALLGRGEPSASLVVWQLRLPRALAAWFSGAGLAVGGLLMQTLFRNPLAGPFVLGISSGASLAVALVVLGFGTMATWLGGLGLAGAAMVGAAATLAAVAIAARHVDTTTLLVLGVLLGAAVSAATTLLLAFASADRLQSYVVWTFGSFGGVTGATALLLATLVAVGILLATTLRRSLDALHLGDREAASLGVDVARVRTLALAATAILAGSITAFCGPIGFLGVAMPHLARALFRTASHRWLLPGSAAAGATAAALADTLVQWPGSSLSLPLGAVTALIGAPWLALVVLRRPRWRELA